MATLDLEVVKKDKTLKVVIERLERLSITPSSSTASMLAIEKGKEEVVVLQVFLNIKKKEKYLKDCRTTILIIILGIDDDDITIIDEYPLLKQL